MTRLASAALHRTRLVLALCLAALAGLGLYGAGALEELRIPQFSDPGSESAQVREDLRDALGHSAEPGVVVLVRGGRPGPVADVLRRDGAFGRVQVVPGRGEALVVGSLRSLDEDASKPVIARLEDRVPEAAREAGGRAVLGGPAVAYVAVADEVESDLPRAEAFAFPLLAVLLVVVFRGVLAAMLPLSLGAVAVVGSLAGLRAINELVPVSVTAANLVTALGLGLAVDYSLFLVSRFREELAGGAAKEAALRTTMATAGRTVVFSSVTVAAALLALCLFPQRFLYSMGLGGAFVAVFAALGALVAIPALMALLGERLTPRERGGGPPSRRWYRAAHAVQRRPAGAAAVALVVLLGLAAPALGLQTRTIDGTALDEASPARVVDRAVAERFPAVDPDPVLVAVDGDPDAVQRRVAAMPNTAAVAPPVRLPDGGAVLAVAQRAGPFAAASTAQVQAIRAGAAGEPPVRATGQAASLVDFRASVADRLPLVLGLLALVTFVVLFVMTGSVLVPLQAVAVNLLSVAAALGLIVLVFQDGRLEGLLDFESAGAIDLASILLVAAVSFGLSTDYGVFLLARVKELRDAGHDDREAVALAVERTNGLITAAAGLLCIAMGALVITSLVFLKETGLATSAAVALDATLVRLLLVPALLRLGGRRTWWAPGPLRRLHGRIGVSEA